MKKFALFALAVLMALTALAGCASQASPATAEPQAATAAPVAPTTAPTETPTDPPTAPPTEAPPEPVELTVSWWGGDSRHTATQDAIDAYTKANPGVTAKTTYGAWDGWEASMSTAFYSNSAPDMNQVNWNWLYLFDGVSTFVDLNTMKDYIDLSQFADTALAQCTIDGKLLAIPVSMTGRIFYWNETTFQNAGIAVPKTKDELLAAGAAFKDKLGDDYYPIAMGEYDRMIFLVWALECKYGKDWVKDGVLQYSKEEIAEGLALITELEKAHVIPTIQTLTGDGAASLDKNPKWIEGKYAGIFEWDSSASKFQAALNPGQNFVVGDYLTGFGDNKGGFTKVSLGFAITKSAKKPEEAAKLINFLLNDETGAKIMKSERGIPLSKAAFDYCTKDSLLDPIVAEANKRVLAWSSNALDPTFEGLKNTDGPYYDAMSGVSYGDYTPEEGADVLIEAIEAALAS
ncbi:MAG: ABC transporter substrate-binding protein [Clostridiales bacterium]|jgi:oligogalacturonide transport system substrate-binding protein|nr:ABC transporter substrate-binding protein [Clostridiales bacterium]MDR2751609.1 ABC transporter substrate-binding protein [Clostridiales bacterium]